MGSPRRGDSPFARFQDEISPPIPEASTSLVHELIRDQARARPQAEAVVAWDGTLSYAELDAASTRLAGHLSATAGVKAETIVPLLFEKSRWAVVGMLAAMKAGGAFMPLDVSQPLPRLRSVIAESGASSVALCSASCHVLCSALVPGAFAVTHETVSGLGTPNAEADEAPHRRPVVGIFDAAYMMATSGSTGAPKLVVTEHAQMASFVAHLTKPLGITNETRAFQFASYAFDPIIGDIFLTLAAGGTVCIPSEHQRKNDIVGAMNTMQVNLAKLTPSLVNSLPDLTPSSVPTLKTLVLGGETAPMAVVEEWAGKVDLKLIYGSTECTVSCVVGVPPDVAPEMDTSTFTPGEIGRPVGSRAWVSAVDSDGSGGIRPAEDGEIGELLVEGPLVSRGYMNDSLQNEAKFIKPRPVHPYRMYRTGDLVRRLADGRLVYVGRVDNQVKIRAQRLELEEVEKHVHLSLAAAVPNVRIKNVLVDAAVPLGGTDKRLVAFLSLDEAEDTSFGSLVIADDDSKDATVRLSPATAVGFAALVAALEGKMRTTVPAHMVPSLWVPIDEMPYTLSRKRDRQRLRRVIQSLSTKTLASFSQAQTLLAQGSSIDGVAATSLMTENEKVLRTLWADLLKVDPDSVQPGNNFFHLGGNSLQVMRLISMARREGFLLVADEVFSTPVLHNLALKLVPKVESKELLPFALIQPAAHRQIVRQTAAQQCRVNPEDIEDIYPLYSMQEFYVFGYPETGRNLAGPWDWQQQIVFRLPEQEQEQEEHQEEHLDIALFKSVWTDAVARHAQLRTRVVQTSLGVFQAVLRREVAPKWQEFDDLETYVRQDRENIMSFGDSLLRLAMTRPPPGKKSTSTSSPQSTRTHFVLTMQHLIYDAYSRDNLFQELEAAYRAARSNTLRIAPPTPPGMNAFVRHVNSADRVAATQFWTSYLAGAVTKPLLSAPTGSPLTATELKTKRWTTPNPLPPPSSSSPPSSSANPIGNNTNYTLATIIETSVALSLARILACPDIIFYSDRAGRNLPIPGIQDLIAPTTLFLPLRVHIDPSQPVLPFLAKHQQQNTAMMHYEYMGFTELRGLSHLRGILAHALNMNINPYTPLSKLGRRGWGMEVVGEHERWGDPFTVDVSVREEEGVCWGVYYDEGFVEERVVDELVGHVKEVFAVLSGVKGELSEGMAVGDVLEGRV